jgi:hypothetical protein
MKKILAVAVIAAMSVRKVQLTQHLTRLNKLELIISGC